MLLYIAYRYPPHKLLLQFRSPKQRFEVMIYDDEKEIVLDSQFLKRMARLIRQWIPFRMPIRFRERVSVHHKPYVPGMWEYGYDYRFDYIPTWSELASEILNLHCNQSCERFIARITFRGLRQLWVDYPELYRALEFVRRLKKIRRHLFQYPAALNQVNYAGFPVVYVGDKRRSLSITDLLLLLSHPQSPAQKLLEYLPEGYYRSIFQVLYAWMIRGLEDEEILSLKL